MDEPTDAAVDANMTEEMEQGVHASPTSPQPCVLTGVCNFVLADDLNVACAQDGVAEAAPEVRAGVQIHGLGRADTSQEHETERNPACQTVAGDGVRSSEIPDATQQLRERARAMFLSGRGKPTGSGMTDSVQDATELTLGAIRDAKMVVAELHVAHNADVKSSWGEPLDEMEALAYLLGDALGHVLIPEEARKLGREAERQLKVAKERSEKLRGNAAARRSKATKAATNDPGKAAVLDERLSAIDRDLQQQRAELWRERARLA